MSSGSLTEDAERLSLELGLTNRAAVIEQEARGWSDEKMRVELLEATARFVGIFKASEDRK